MMDPNLLLSFGLFIIGLATLSFVSAARFLSIREHETYQRFVTREMDNVAKRIEILEQTRPTTGEIEARLWGTVRTRALRPN